MVCFHDLSWRRWCSGCWRSAMLAGLCLSPLLGCDTLHRSEGSQPSLTSTCQAPRPEICTREYRPVCGYRDDGSWHTYGNACTACADTAVTGHNPGQCPATRGE